MYKIRTQISQDCEYTDSYLKEDGNPEIKIGNYEAGIIRLLQYKITNLENKLKELEYFTNTLSKPLHK
jgi:hypothetical protein